MSLRSRVSYLICAFLITLPVFAQQASLTNEWIYSEQGGAHVAEVSDFTWLNDGSAIIYNPRLSKVQRAFEKLNPATGKSEPMLKMADALASLHQLGITEEKDTLPWPEAFDASGQRALY